MNFLAVIQSVAPAAAAIGLAAGVLWSAGDVLGADVADRARCVRSRMLRDGEEPQKLVLDVSGFESLALVNLSHFNHKVIWGDPVLIGRDGQTTRLGDLKPDYARIGDSRLLVNQGPLGMALQVGRKKFAHGLCGNSKNYLVYPLKGRYVRFETWVGVSHLVQSSSAAAFQVWDNDYYQLCQLALRFQHGFASNVLARLQRNTRDLRERNRLSAERAQALLEQLREFESQADRIRQGIGRDPEPYRGQLLAFQEVVRELHRAQLDAPLLFVTHDPLDSPHIYDDYLFSKPGGGIYVIENPAAPPEQHIIRAIVDPTTTESPGIGIYRDPEISFDGRRILFAFKGASGSTCIYEIGVDGRGLRQLTRHDPPASGKPPPDGLVGGPHHDFAPCYLPDGRIAFLSTRSRGLVMCFNNFITTLHTMNADGGDIRGISVNNASEFDPTMLPDGRLLFGRWEYIDKTALYLHGLWTVNPDGSGEAALFANNLARPTAVLDARPVPGSDLIAATLTPHDGQDVGPIAMIDPNRGKNRLSAIFNFTPEYPTEIDKDIGRGPCEPWPLSEDLVLIAHHSEAHGAHGVIELIDRLGLRSVIHGESNISCYSPMLIKPRPVPPLRSAPPRSEEAARFLVHDVYRGMEGVKRGEVKRLRVVETTTRVSGVPEGGRWWNQAFLVSWQGSYDVKRVLGVVPVEPDGSAYFEAPPHKALYFQALDAEGRLVQSMRTFVQASPGVTRSCTGCHVPDDDGAPDLKNGVPMAARRPADRIAPESWGNGSLDYPSRIQPALDRHCVSCHGGEQDIAGGLDFSGGWTWAFSIGYETMLKHALTGFLNCRNEAVQTVDILPPRAHGSGAAPLARLLLGGHDGRLEQMTPAEKDLLLAWMDGNCNYRGTYDYTEHATCDGIRPLRDRLALEMNAAGCVKCHTKMIGNDWVNLEKPEWSRILRAPLAREAGGHGLAWCRKRKAQPVRLPLVGIDQEPPDVFCPQPLPPPDRGGKPRVTFADPSDPAYQRILRAIQEARLEALQSPRADMPGAIIKPGQCRDAPGA